jgi:hypothetical protein
VGPKGNQLNQIIFSISQRSGVTVVPDPDIGGNKWIPFQLKDGRNLGENDFEFRGGCTLIYDLDFKRLRYVITKPLIDVRKMEQGVREIDYQRFNEQHRHQLEFGMVSTSEYNQYFGADPRSLMNEPFALLHQH